MPDAARVLVVAGLLVAALAWKVGLAWWLLVGLLPKVAAFSVSCSVAGTVPKSAVLATSQQVAGPGSRQDVGLEAWAAPGLPGIYRRHRNIE